MTAALEQAELLDWLVTQWCFTSSQRRWAAKIGLDCARRTAAPVSLSKLRRVWRADLQQKLRGLAGCNRFETIDASFATVDQYAANLVSSSTAAVLGREDGCLGSFQRAKFYGRPRIYLLPTAHYATVRRCMQREAEEFPEVFGRGEIEADFRPDRMARKEAELKGASFVVCPSSFVQRSLHEAGIGPQQVVLIPFGAETMPGGTREARPGRVFLYVGKINARKGVHRLIRVWKQLGAYRTHRLRLIGDLELPARFVAEYRNVFEHSPRMARERLPGEYAKAQAFVFNAMADGFGHVFAEAMGCATPVLASRNCGAPDLIRDGVEGKLFDYGDDDALGAALEWALTHPGQLREMGATARERARQCSWDNFGERFLGWVRRVLSQQQ